MIKTIWSIFKDGPPNLEEKPIYTQKIIIGITLAFTLLYLQLSSKILVVCLEDSFEFILRARAIANTPFKLHNYVNGFYPFGYPLALTTFFPLFKDYLLVQKFLSLASAVLLLAVFFKTCTIFVSNISSCFAAVFVGCNKYFLYLAVTDNTDLPAAALCFSALYLILKSTKYKEYILAGSLLGLGYMVRYTALILLPVFFVWILFIPLLTRERKMAVAVAFLGGFAAIAGFQLFLSYSTMGDPFYNTQAVNVWFGIYGEHNFSKYWREAQNHQSLLDTFLIDPARFVINWWSNFKRIFLSTFFNFPLYVFSFLGTISLIVSKQKFHGWLIVISGLVFGAVISIAFVHQRLVIFLLPGQVLLAIAGVEIIIKCLNELPGIARIFIPGMIRWATYSGIMLLILFDHVAPIWKQPLTAHQIEVLAAGNRLTHAGMNDPWQVLSFSFNMYDVTSPYKTGFQLPWFWYGQEFHSVSELVWYMKNKGHRYLVWDQNATYNIKSLQPFWHTVAEDTLFNKQYSEIYSGKLIHVFALK